VCAARAAQKNNDIDDFSIDSMTNSRSYLVRDDFSWGYPEMLGFLYSVSKTAGKIIDHYNQLAEEEEVEENSEEEEEAESEEVSGSSGEAESSDEEDSDGDE
jgi:hypothetical protein